MRKVATVLMLVFGLSVLAGVLGGAASAETCTPIGCTAVNEGGWTFYADGNPNNRDPSDGYVGIKNGKVCSDDNGSPDRNDRTGDGSSSPTCSPS